MTTPQDRNPSLWRFAGRGEYWFRRLVNRKGPDGQPLFEQPKVGGDKIELLASVQPVFNIEAAEFDRDPTVVPIAIRSTAYKIGPFGGGDTITRLPLYRNQDVADAILAEYQSHDARIHALVDVLSLEVRAVNTTIVDGERVVLDDYIPLVAGNKGRLGENRNGVTSYNDPVFYLDGIPLHVTLADVNDVVDTSYVTACATHVEHRVEVVDGQPPEVRSRDSTCRFVNNSTAIRLDSVVLVYPLFGRAPDENRAATHTHAIFAVD